MPRKSLVLVLGIAAGVAGGFLAGRHGLHDTPAPESARKALYWWDPMMPAFRSNRPGKSPMGMDMVPVYARDPSADAGGGVTVPSGIAQSLGVRTAAAEQGALTPEIETFGVVSFDESRTSHVHVRAKGWVERLHHRVVGETVERGDVLLEFFSPDLASASFEFVRELERASAAGVDGARRKLMALGVDERQIEEIRRTRQVPDRVRLFAPQSGAIVQHNVAEGMYIEPDQTLMAITELSTVWIFAELFEGEAAAVRAGHPATITIKGFPGRRWSGDVDYIYPELKPETRTVRLRIRLENPDRVLRPDMFATVKVAAEPRAPAVLIPREALIRTAGGDRAVVAAGDGRYQVKAVKAGLVIGNKAEILEGLAAGDRVVTSGHFLIDSESSLSGGLNRLAQASSSTATGPIWTDATVHATADGKVNLSHPPIAAIAWPAMTMDFAIDPAVPPEQLRPGTKLRVGLAANPDGTYRVVAVEPAGGGR